jgi:hypothetical protein
MPRRTGSGFACATGIIPTSCSSKEWNAHGEQTFQYEILEELEGDLPALAIPDLLKEKQHYWIAQLGALPV